ncbi:hypothetical protein Tco_1347054 [Tanacetum coccineum]
MELHELCEFQEKEFKWCMGSFLEFNRVEDVAVRLLEWVKVAISYLGFWVAKVLVQLQNKVASYALSRVLKVAEALGSIAA